MIEPRVSVPMAKPTRPGGRRRPGPGRRSARALFRVPRVPRLPAEPAVPLRERAHRELGDEHGAGLPQPLDDGGVVVDDLLLKRRRAEGRRDALGGEQVLGAPGNAVQRTAVPARLDLAVGRRRLLERQVLRSA